jgi:hypothetical protein
MVDGRSGFDKNLSALTARTSSSIALQLVEENTMIIGSFVFFASTNLISSPPVMSGNFQSTK